MAMGCRTAGAPRLRGEAGERALPCALCWRRAVWLLYLGRLLTGLGVGANIVIVSLYCEEIAEVRVRGVIGSYLDMSTSSGLLLMYVLGAFVPYFWFTAACVAPAAATLLLFWCMPESPAFLVGRGRRDAARRALRWLRGPAVDVQPELDALCLAAKAPDSPADARSPAGPLLACCPGSKLDRATAKALVIVFGLMFFSQATGGTAFVYYTEDVFRAVNSGLPGDICMVIVGAVSIVGTFLSIMLVDRVGRRFILILSSICLSVSLLGFSVYAHFDGKGVDLTSWNWTPLVCLVVVMFNISFGYGPIKYFMMAELMPTEAKGWGSSVCVCFSRIFSFTIAKEFPIMTTSLGQDVTYAIFCVFSFLGTLFIVFFVPETKGKTREQIQQELTNKKPNQERLDKQDK
ncbi:Facilitated trehalose transporter Tret1, partial [Gryllus bimaculatus]